MSGINLFDAINSANWVDQNNILFQELNQAVASDIGDRVSRLVLQIDNSLSIRTQLDSLIYTAITQRKINALKAILAHPRVDPNIIVNDEKTALMIAVESNYLEAVNLLIDCDAKINTLDADGWTVLDLAANLGSLEIVTSLIDHPNCDVTKHHPIPAAALHFHANTKEIFNILLQNGADPNAVISNPAELETKQTALHWLCETELDDEKEKRLLIKFVELLLEDERTDPNIFDNDGHSLLHKIAQDKICTSNEMIEVLLNSEKIVIDALSKNGETALYFSAVTLNYAAFQPQRLSTSSPRNL